ncbi:MAG TPA: DNA polymerase Y family protein [Candidatus Binataceae bacterium]|nr:DNA polymerase Y family protein [Candidatus Binataceae bacterium]
MARIACILVPDFSIAALMRANPAYADAVLAISTTLAPHGELAAVSSRARKLGIRPAMTIAQARAVSSDLLVALRSPAAESSAHAALADAAESVSPAVEPGRNDNGCVWVDLSGLTRIYADENEIAAEILRRVHRMGMEPAVGIAADKSLAHLAARGGGVRVIEAGREREFLDWMPLDMLGLGRTARGDDLETTLARWGIRRLGELARLDPDAIGTRLGREGVELIRLARGAAASPLVPRGRAEVFTEALDLEYGIDNLEPLAFVMRAMLERLAERLEVRGLAAGDILIALGLEGHRTFSRNVPMAAATTDARAMLTLINLSLEAAAPEAAVESIRLEITPRAPRPAQADMFLPPAPAPDRLETTLARLAALCGPDNVGTLASENSHRPEAMRIASFTPPPASPVSENGNAKNVTQLVIRAIRPAREIEVMSSRGIPEFVRGDNLGARIVSIAGPWRRDGEWWRGALSDPPAQIEQEELSDKKLWNAIRRRGEVNDALPSYPGKQWNVAVSTPAPGTCYQSAAPPIALNLNPASPTSNELRKTESPHGGRMMWKHPRDVSAENLKSLAAEHTQNGSHRSSTLSDPSPSLSEPSPSPSVPSPYPRRGQGRGPTSAAPLPSKFSANPHPAQTASAPPSPWSGRGTESARDMRETPRGYIREYYEFALEDGGVYRVYRDIKTEQWFVDGIYD